MDKIETAVQVSQSADGVWDQLSALVLALAGLTVALIQALLPWTPLLAWIAFWLLAVNWRKLYPILMRGGLVGVILTALMAILVWSSLAEPEGGFHYLLGLKVNNIYGKLVYVTGLAVIAALCGTVQLSGSCDALCRFEEPSPPEEDLQPAHH